ncbi:MAG: DNA-directed RNA polymerase subunit omega [Oscillospiraceae bacterium]|nr:DNA-directed RNA polymerase subunit omega [Oscillospiraceae bacterium]
MHRPSAQELVKQGQSQYSLVIGVAKRARVIAQEAEENKKELIVKPVQIAVEEFEKGDFKID